MSISSFSPSTCRFNSNILASVKGYSLKDFLPTLNSCGLPIMTSVRSYSLSMVLFSSMPSVAESNRLLPFASAFPFVFALPSYRVLGSVGRCSAAAAVLTEVSFFSGPYAPALAANVMSVSLPLSSVAPLVFQV